jgi:hypothetical protein
VAVDAPLDALVLPMDDDQHGLAGLTMDQIIRDARAVRAVG